MAETPVVDAPKKSNVLNLVFIAVSLVLSVCCLVFYSLWQASKLTCSTQNASPNNISDNTENGDSVLPTTKPSAPKFIYPPSGEDKNSWQTVKTNIQTEVNFELAYPKMLLAVKEDNLRNKENYWYPLLKYHFFTSEADKNFWSECSKKYATWNAGLQIPSSANSASYKAPPCKPSDFELFNLSFDTIESPQVNSSQSTNVTSANYRSWSIGELIENGEGGEYGYEAKTILNDSGLIIQVFLVWPNKVALDRTESLLGYDSKTLLNNLLTQMNFGENGTYGKPN